MLTKQQRIYNKILRSALVAKQNDEHGYLDNGFMHSDVCILDDTDVFFMNFDQYMETLYSSDIGYKEITEFIHSFKANFDINDYLILVQMDEDSNRLFVVRRLDTPGTIIALIAKQNEKMISDWKGESKG